MPFARKSKYVTAAHCIYCYWSQDLGKIFKRKHKMAKEPIHTCPRCKTRTEQSLGRYLYQEVFLLLGMIPFVRVCGFVVADEGPLPSP